MSPKRPKQSDLREAKTLLRRIKSVKQSGYDISNECNFNCHGCHYFDNSERVNIDRNNLLSSQDWKSLFAKEKERGVNFPHIAGAEPSFRPDVLSEAHSTWKRGVIYSNGSIKIDEKIRYRILLSLWGGKKTDALARNTPKEFAFKVISENYAGDPRAIIFYTLTPENIIDLREVLQFSEEIGLKTALHLYSPTISSIGQFKKPDPYCWDTNSLKRAKQEIFALKEEFAKTLMYNKLFHSLALTPKLERQIVNNIDINCPVHKTKFFRQIGVDGYHNPADKCCMPSIECSTCRTNPYLLPMTLAKNSLSSLRNEQLLPDYHDYLLYWIQYHGLDLK